MTLLIILVTSTELYLGSGMTFLMGALLDLMVTWASWLRIYYVKFFYPRLLRRHIHREQCDT